MERARSLVRLTLRKMTRKAKVRYPRLGSRVRHRQARRRLILGVRTSTRYHAITRAGKRVGGGSALAVGRVVC